MFIPGIGAGGTVSGWSQGFDWAGLFSTGLDVLGGFIQAREQRKALKDAQKHARVMADMEAQRVAGRQQTEAILAEYSRWQAAHPIPKMVPPPTTIPLVPLPPVKTGDQKTIMIVVVILGAMMLAGKR